MRKRILGIIVTLAMVLSLLPMEANAVVTDPKYTIYPNTLEPQSYSWMRGGSLILEAGLMLNHEPNTVLYLSQDGSGDQDMFFGIVDLADKPLPDCESGYWYLEGVEIKEQGLLELVVTYYFFELRQAYPLTFVYSDMSQEDQMLFALKNRQENSLLSNRIPEREGYTFLGWYTEGGDQVYDGEGQYVVGEYWDEAGRWIGHSGLILYARWQGNTYTASFEPNGGSCGAASAEVTFGNPYGNLPQPERFGFTFNGWATKQADGTIVDDETNVFIAADHTLYAQWEANANPITAVVDEQYGTAQIPTSARTQEKVRIEATPKDGCRLDRILVYNTNNPTETIGVDADNCFVMPGYPVTVEVLFASYQKEIALNFTTPEYGTCGVDRTAAGVGETVTITATPNRGYFVQTMTVTPEDPTYSVTVEPDGTFLMPSCPVRVDVSFAKSVYTITVQAPDEERGTLEVAQTQAGYGDTVTVNAQPAEGYAIRAIVVTDESGNQMGVGESFTMPDSNITVGVTFMVVPTYTVTIPATVELNGAPMTLAVNDAVMEAGVELQIILHTDLTVQTPEGAENTYRINDGAVNDGDVVLSVAGGGTPEEPKSGSVDLYFTRVRAPQYSGNYTGTIGFTIRMTDTALEYR